MRKGNSARICRNGARCHTNIKCSDGLKMRKSLALLLNEFGAELSPTRFKQGLLARLPLGVSTTVLTQDLLAQVGNLKKLSTEIQPPVDV